MSATAGLIQCGSLDGTGAGDPKYAFGPIENAPADGLYKAGTIALARSGTAYSQDHQFFIVFKDTQLPADAAGGYTVFGHVTSGLDKLVSGIAEAGIAQGGTSAEDGPPVTPTKISSVTIK
jgi:peptidyl-prolyl cis-trans isomerase B (cyclophilin B)